jgi:hypothetical protein
MKMKLIAILAVFAVAAGTQAAVVSIPDFSIMQGTASISIPVNITPSVAGEQIGAYNSSVSVGNAADNIPITGGSFGSIWTAPVGVVGTEGGTVFHNVTGGVTQLSPPLQVSANGSLFQYTIDTSGLAPGIYVLNPNHQVDAGGGIFVGSSGDPNVGGTPTSLTFDTGQLTVVSVIPEPSTVALSVIFAVLGLGVAIKRRRG